MTSLSLSEALKWLNALMRNADEVTAMRAYFSMPQPP